jgi:23S rRNA (adenine2503-C2)-methyltransferase
MKQAITDIPSDDLANVLVGLGMKSYAAGQLKKWLYQKRAASFEDMTDLSKESRIILEEKYVVDAVAIDEVQESDDGTKKYLCRAPDGATVECVLIPMDVGRQTVCLSTQVGCAMGCTFCRTAGMGFVRNLSVGEIIGQLLVVMRSTGIPVTNVVLMGMGEPLANLDAVIDAVKIITDPLAIGISKQRVTLSTCGLLAELAEFAAVHEIKIAISLSAATDEVRDRIMPVNKKYPIHKIIEFCKEYSKLYRHRMTFEYILIGGVNDSKEDAKKLANLLGDVRAKINLIPLNPFEGSGLDAPDPEVVEWWSRYLYDRGIQTNVRASKGQDILAACGQLATKDSDKKDR